MVVHYPRTVWKNSYAEHELTGKTYNLKKKNKKSRFYRYRRCAFAQVEIDNVLVALYITDHFFRALIYPLPQLKCIASLQGLNGVADRACYLENEGD